MVDGSYALKWENKETTYMNITSKGLIISIIDDMAHNFKLIT